MIQIGMVCMYDVRSINWLPHFCACRQVGIGRMSSVFLFPVRFVGPPRGEIAAVPSEALVVDMEIKAR